MTDVNPLDHLPSSLAHYVSAFAARQRRAKLAQLGGAACAGVIFWSLAWALIDRIFPLHAAVRGAVTGVGICFGARIAYAIFRTPDRTNWPMVAAAIERCERCFAQRLETVVSEFGRPSDQRGSAAMLERLVGEVTAISEQGNAPKVPERLGARRAIAMTLAMLTLFTMLMSVSSLGLPRLVARQVLFWRYAAPVTVTYLDIAPGSASVVRGEPLRVRVRTTNLDGPAPVVRVSEDGVRWITASMRKDEVDQYSYSIATVQRSFQYRVTGGDAAAGPFVVSVREVADVSDRPSSKKLTTANSVDPANPLSRHTALPDEREDDPYAAMRTAYQRRIADEQ